jgi:hypothetical protein
MQNDLADALRAMIQEFPLNSCERLCIYFRLGKASCLRILYDVLHLQKFNLRWIPHSFGDAQRAERVSLSTDLLRILQENQKTDFASVMRDNESWFLFEYPHQSIWVSFRDEVPEKIKRKNHIEKCLISLILLVNGMHSLVDVPKGITHNTIFFYDVVFHDLLANVCAWSRRRTLKRI